MTAEHPTDLAIQIAKLISSDPVAARQVREHLSEERLIELLEIKPPQTATLDEALENCSDEDIDRELRQRYTTDLSAQEDEALAKECLHRWPTRSRILDALFG